MCSEGKSLEMLFFWKKCTIWNFFCHMCCFSCFFTSTLSLFFHTFVNNRCLKVMILSWLKNYCCKRKCSCWYFFEPKKSDKTFKHFTQKSSHNCQSVENKYNFLFPKYRHVKCRILSTSKGVSTQYISILDFVMKVKREGAYGNRNYRLWAKKT